jgi:anaerobic ribonucleoside-triphosphate reductase activating protein
MATDIIAIAEIADVSEVNGPGARAVVWVQGCPKRCPGCWNPDYLSFSSQWRLSPEELFEAVKSRTVGFKLIEGITFSGGEPFAQAAGLAESARLFRKEGLTLMSYSGFTAEEINQKGKPYTDLLDQLDILVDGEFIKEQQCNRLWRSSANQKIHFLSDRYHEYKKLVSQDLREFEVVLSGNDLRITGFPKLDLLRKIK